jgi:hypothetical protein
VHIEKARFAIETYEAHFRTCEVDEAQGRVTHHAKGSLLPTWTGS